MNSPRRTVLVCSILTTALACGRKSNVRPDPKAIASAPSATISALPPVPSPSPAPSAPVHVIATPPCTPSARITWLKSPHDVLACSPMVTTAVPLEITVAPKTPVRLHLKAADSAAKGGFSGVYRAVGLPSGASLDARTGDLAWYAAASTAPYEIGLAAIADADAGLGECVTATVTIRVEENVKTLENLLRWTYFVPLRDADLESIPSNEEIGSSYWDGETPEMTASRQAKERKAAFEARKRYVEDLGCGKLPGGWLRQVDVDGDKLEDALFGLEQGHRTLVMLRTATGMKTVGKVLGHAKSLTYDGHMLFHQHWEAEGAADDVISWIESGKPESTTIHSPRGSSHLEFEDDPKTGGIRKVVLVFDDGKRDEHEWTGGSLH